MDYDNISLSYDPKVTGIKDGGAQVELSEHHYDKAQLTKIRQYFSGINWEERNRFPDFDFIYYGKLNRGAKLTDFMSFSPFFMGCLFLLNDKALSTLKSFALQPHYIFNAVIETGKRTNEQYNLFFMPPLEFDVVNFNESVFYNGTELLGKSYLHFSNYSEYKAGKNSKGIIRVEKLVFNDQLDINYHLFGARLGRVYVSTDLSRHLSGYSGIDLQKPQNPMIVV